MFKNEVTVFKGGGIVDTMHHWKLIWQFKALRKEKGFIAIMHDGDHVDMRHQPRVGERTWISRDGKQIDSSDIAVIIGSSEYGYKG